MAHKLQLKMTTRIGILIAALLSWSVQKSQATTPIELLPLSLLCDDASAATCTVSGNRILFEQSVPCNRFEDMCVPIYQFVMNTSLVVSGSLSCEQRGYFKACGIQINTTFPVVVSPGASIQVSA